jgi:beta-glucosidase
MISRIQKLGWIAGLAMATIARAQSTRPDDFDARARAIVAQMTLDEKISQLYGVSTKTENRIVPGLERLHIPARTGTNGPAGAGPAGPGHGGPATALPAPISLAATWDVEGAKQNGAVAATESRELGNLFLESPDINIARTPHNGRTFEGFGEDPFLAGKLAVGNIQGIQAQHVVANVKHFAANNQESDRFKIDEIIDERTLREIYLPAFEAAVVDGHVGSVMGAYNKINGVFCCENEMLLKQILKGDWHFDGFVTSDFGAVHSTLGCAINGLDVEMPSGKFWGKLKPLVESGQVPVAVIDEKLIRRYRTMMKLGAWSAPEKKPIDEAAGAAVARRLAIEGTVLLKNDQNILPLKMAALKSIALIGPGAEKASTGGGGSSHVKPLHAITAMQGLAQKLGDGVTITVDDGKDIAKAAALAKSADLALVLLVDHQSEGADHPIGLTGGQNELTDAVLAANPKSIVVLKTGGPVLMPWIDQASTILEMWYPGEEEGNALAAMLFGDAEPEGRLPITFPRSDSDLPTNTPAQYPGIDGQAHYSEGILVGYRWYDTKKIEPLFPFGFGMSYTKFEYKNLTVKPAEKSVEFDVTNVGDRPGVTVAQLYLGLPDSAAVPEPVRQLKGFARLEISAGQSVHEVIPLDSRALRYWDITKHNWKQAAGPVKVEVGTSSRDIRLAGTADLTG